MAIVSASTPYAVSPVAHDLGLGDDYLATRLEVVSGRFTGGVIEPPCYGAGKVTLARAYSAQHNLDLAASYFYTDSHHDLPLLEVGGTSGRRQPESQAEGDCAGASLEPGTFLLRQNSH